MAQHSVEGAEHPNPGAIGRELVVVQFGLVPPCVKSASDIKLPSTKLVNALSEIVSTSNNFRGAWLNAAEPEKAREFMRAYPAEGLTANPIEKKPSAA